LLMILGVSGSIMEFEPELDRLFHPHLSYVTPGPRILSLNEIGAAVSQKFGGEPVVAYRPALSPDISSQVVLPRGIAYVNQYTGEVLGVRARGQTFLGFVRALHVRLAIGDVGRNMLRWSGAAMLISLASGFYLWWPAKQVRIRGDWRSKGFLFDVHNAFGIFSLLLLALLAATGAVLGFEDQLAPLVYKLTRSVPAQTTRTAIQKPEAGISPITPDQAVMIARTRIPGALPYRVQLPSYGSLYQVALLYPNDRVAGERNVVALDPYGNILSVTRSSDLSRGDRALAMNEALHTGSIFGMPTRIAAWIGTMMLVVQVTSGLLTWLRRTATRVAAGRSTTEEPSV
jgi:uncharacterized iron-regulated membrane protein